MRKRFEQNLELDAVPISEVKLDGKSRHQLFPLLAALQYIFITPEINKRVFALLEDRVTKSKKKTGRHGMTLWEILVLGVVRLNLNSDFDNLHDLANNHKALRGILGVDTNQVFSEGKYYHLQTIKDNVQLLDAETIKEINLIIVQSGHKLKKKGEEEKIELVLKADTYPVEANIHFPTDINLLWDSARKCIDTMDEIVDRFTVIGWRKRKYWYKKIKKYYRRTANIHMKKGSNYITRLQSSTIKYLDFSSNLSEIVTEGIENALNINGFEIELIAMIEVLNYYHEMLEKHIDLVHRRIILGEKIPHEEKIFSIFEPHVEWLEKGKAGRKVEIGHNTLVVTDQYQFIVHHDVLFKQADAKLPIPLLESLKLNFPKTDYLFHSISFDKGFWSKTSKKRLEEDFETVVMPRKGKKSKKAAKEENSKKFRKLLNAHSAVESNINELEHSGGDVVPDKGEHGFTRYVAYSVLAYNLKRLGRIVIEKNLIDTVIDLKVERKKAA